ELAAHPCQTLLQDGDSLGMKFQWNAESLGHAIGGDVVMRGSDASGGEDVSVLRAQGIERLDDRDGLVGNYPHLLQINPDGGEVVGDVADVLVLGPT